MSAAQAKAGAKAKGPPPPIIIVKRVKKHGGHEGSHGAWKVAYADFVTAMMAFFLVMWITGQSQDVKRAIGGFGFDLFFEQMLINLLG